MKKCICRVVALSFLLGFVCAGNSAAGTLVIRMHDGSVMKLDTAKISSLTFSEGGQGGMQTGMPSSGMGDFGLSISCNWTSSESGSMAIQQYGSDVRATYPLKNGRIQGRMNGTALEGYWIQDSSGRRCSYPVDNSYYWGRIRLNFTSQSYSGSWGYCDDEPRSNWHGTRK